MQTPDITAIQKGGAALFAAVALACITTGVTGHDLLAYLGSTAAVAIGAMISDKGIRRGRAEIATAAQYAAGTDDE